MLRCPTSAICPLALVLAACSSAGSADHSDHSELTGTAVAEVTLAPTTARCAIIKVVGKSTVTQSFDIAPETSTVLDLQGLPFGQDKFSAKAYPVTCSAVTPSTPPSWISEPVVADVEPNAAPTVTLQMYAPDAGGSATVGLNFPAPPGAVTEFAVPTASSLPYGITPGSDGNLWFTEQGANMIGRITPDGHATEFMPTGGPGVPFDIAAGSDGNLWFTQQQTGAGYIGRIATSGVVTQFSTGLTPNSEPSYIAAGPDGALWFSEFKANKIGRIQTNGSISEFTVPTPSSGPFGIASGPDGNLWFVELFGNKVGRLTPGGTFTEFVVPTASSLPTSIATGPDGNLWFSEGSGTSNKIGKITTSGVITEYTIPTPSAGPSDVCAGPDGNVWVAETAADQIAFVTPAGAFTEFPVPTPGAGPVGCTAGPDGNVWFTESASGKIAYVTP